MTSLICMKAQDVSVLFLQTASHKADCFGSRQAGSFRLKNLKDTLDIIIRMSVILSACKKSVKPKSAKPKKKRTKPQGTDGASSSSTPPMSNENTKVWHWDLKGKSMTVMYNRMKDEVWCNGEIMQHKRVDKGLTGDFGDGWEIQFYILMDDSDVHQGCIKRIITETGYFYQFFCDGSIRLEHSSEAQPNLAYSPFQHDPYGAHGMPDYDDCAPPPYDPYDFFKKDN